MTARRWQWQGLLGLGLLAASMLLFGVHVLVFRDTRQLVFYLLLDLVFVPIQVLFVTLIIDQLLTRRERRAMLEKMNMAIGAFFSEAGTRLLAMFSAFTRDQDKIREASRVTLAWSRAEFARARRSMTAADIALRSQDGDLAAMREFLGARRTFLLNLLQNSNLLEHETFTDMLWAVFHLAEELAYRRELTGLPAADYAHLSGDMQRAFGLLRLEWLAYLQHLQQSYPYLFSLAVRTNPFDPQADVVVRA